MRNAAAYVRRLDPRLKMAIALVLGPCLWGIGILPVAVCGSALFFLLRSLIVSQPLGRQMVRGLVLFVVFWVALKIGIESFSGIAPSQLFLDGGELAVRLFSLLMLGLSLALSTSARSLGLAVSWAIRPFVGRERAWQAALSLALMIHFLPICLSTMAQVKETLGRRCPDIGIWQRILVIPQATIRNLGQKTWNQTLAVAGRGLDNESAWEPDFSWNRHDSLWSFLATCLLLAYVLA